MELPVANLEPQLSHGNDNPSAADLAAQLAQRRSDWVPRYLPAAKLQGGVFYLAYNDSPRSRTPLKIARSKDDGKTWENVATAEDTPGEYSYPALIEASDGKLHLVYTWNRKHIKHLTYDPRTFKG